MTDQRPFYRLTPEKRRERLAQQANLSKEQLDCLQNQSSRFCNELVENYVTD